MTGRVSLVLVLYRSSAVVADAVASFRREAAEAGVESEVVLVDHSEDPIEASLVGRCRPEVFLVRPNRGYAAGVNAGVAASQGDTVLLGNPDVVFEDGSLVALLDALGGAAEIVGPRFVLGDLSLPPADPQTPGEELLRLVASRSPVLWRWALRREVRRYLATWRAGAPVPVRWLNGALLACRRATFDRVGPWEESYFLYFEETDWLRRARRLGHTLALAPAARVTHLWAHAADPARCAAHHERSRRRYYRAHFGWRGRAVLAVPPGAHPPAFPELPSGPTGATGETLWLVSPSPWGTPAAGVVGGEDALRRALAAVSRRRGESGRYTVLALEPASARLRTGWRWEPRRG